jgi:hypothetical protein
MNLSEAMEMVIKEEKESSRKGAKNAKGKKDFYLLISFFCFLSDLCGSSSSALFVRGA